MKRISTKRAKKKTPNKKQQNIEINDTKSYK